MGNEVQSRTKGNPFLQVLMASSFLAVIIGPVLMFSSEPELGDLLSGGQVIGAAIFSVGLVGIFGWLVAGAIVWHPAPVLSPETPASDATTTENASPADWYDDPDGSGNQRWYNGKEWTDSTRSRPS